MSTVTRDVELAGWSKQQLIDFMDTNSVPAGDLSPSKVRKSPKDDLVQFILEWEQSKRMAQQASNTNHQNTPSSKNDSFYTPKNYNPSIPSKDAFRLKRLPTDRNRDRILEWCNQWGFLSPEFAVDKNGLTMVSSGVTYDLWATGGTYYAVSKS